MWNSFEKSSLKKPSSATFLPPCGYRDDKQFNINELCPDL